MSVQALYLTLTVRSFKVSFTCFFLFICNVELNSSNQSLYKVNLLFLFFIYCIGFSLQDFIINDSSGILQYC